MKSKYFITILFLLIFLFSAQGVGVGFNYFFPSNGPLGAPLPLLSAGTGIKIVPDFVNLNILLAVNNLGGLGISADNIKVTEPGVGPSLYFTATFPLELGIRIGPVKIAGHAGGFLFRALTPSLLMGNIEPALKEKMGWDVLDADLSFTNHWGYGWVAGGDITYFINKKIGVTLGATYYDGSAPFSISGTLSGYDGSYYSGQPFIFENCTLDYKGIKIYLGGSYEL